MFGAHLIPDQCNLATKELPNRLSNTYLLLMFSEIICKYREVLSEYRKLLKQVAESNVKKLCLLLNLKNRDLSEVPTALEKSEPTTNPQSRKYREQGSKIYLFFQYIVK